MLQKFAELVIRRKWTFFAALMVITCWFGYQMTKIEIFTSFEDLLPQSHPYIQTHLEYVDQLGDPFKVFLMLRVKEGDIFNVTTLKKIKDITESIDAIPGINHNQVYSLASSKLKRILVDDEGVRTASVMPDLPETDEDAIALRTNVHRTAGTYGLYVSLDDKNALFSASFISALMDYNVIYDKVNEIIEKETDSNHVFYAAGDPLLAATIERHRNEMYVIFIMTGVAMLLLLFLYFRNIVGVVVPFISTVTCAIWGLGFTGAIGFNLDPLILVIPLLVTARALSHSVQMTERYFESYHEVGDVKEAAIEMIISIYPPGLLGIVTDSLGILLIAVAPIPVVQKLAYLSGFWAISIVMNGMLLTPILLSAFSPPKNIPDIVDLERGITQKILTGLSKLSSGKTAYVTFVVLVVVGCFAGYRSLQVQIGELRPGTPILWPDSFYNVSIGEVNKSFPGTEELFIIAQGTGSEFILDPEVLQSLLAFQRHMEEDPEVATTISLADLIQPYLMNFNYGYPKWQIVPDSQRLTGTMLYMMYSGASPGDYDRYFSEDASSANIIVSYKDHRGETLKGALKRASDYINAYNSSDEAVDGLTFRLASGNIGILAGLNECIRDSQLLNYILVMASTFLLCATTFRSFMAALFLAIPLNLTNFITLSLMSYMQIGLNINTLPIASLGVGIGIDYGIYLLSRICEEYQRHKDYPEAFRVALKTSGKAIFFTATTMAVGTIFWYFFSSLRFQAEMGLLLTLIMCINMVMALIMLPTLVFIFKPKFVARLTHLVKG